MFIIYVSLHHNEHLFNELQTVPPDTVPISLHRSVYKIIERRNLINYMVRIGGPVLKDIPLYYEVTGAQLTSGSWQNKYINCK